MRITEETNLLINPLAPDMDRLGVQKVRRWLFDPRLWQGTG